MGLTIHFSLKLPRNINDENAAERISDLRHYARSLPAEEISRLVDLHPNEASDWRWAICQHSHTLRYAYDGRGVPRYRKHGRYSMPVPAVRMIGFSMQPGPGCEDFNLFICRYPSEADVPDERRGALHRVRLTGANGWLGHAFCKTQYASDPECGGIPNFLRCHLLVIAVLDKAKELGFRVDVHDEGGYWLKRSVVDLCAQIQHWNEFISAFFKDLVSRFGESHVLAHKPEATPCGQVDDAVLHCIRETKGTVRKFLSVD